MNRLRGNATLLVMAGVAIVLLLVVLSSCAKANEPFKDAPTSGRNDSPAQIIEMPDGFSNLAGKCDGQNYVYVVFHGDNKYGSIAVVPNDPRCGGSTP